MNQSLMLVTALNPHIGNYVLRTTAHQDELDNQFDFNDFYVIGYDNAAAVAKKAHKENLTVNFNYCMKV